MVENFYRLMTKKLLAEESPKMKVNHLKIIGHKDLNNNKNLNFLLLIN